MTRRAGNPVRAVRWGAVVLLAMAGTVATLVISEWPLTGETIARYAATPKPAGGVTSRHTPIRPVDLSLRGTFMPAEPDPFAPMPVLMAAGSAAESRRDVRSLVEGMPPPRVLRGVHGEHLTSPIPSLPDYYEWLQKTPAGRLVEDVSSYDPTRTAATLSIDPRVNVTAGVTKFNSGDGPSVGRVAFEGEAGTPRARLEPGETELYDLSVRMDALEATPASPFSVGAIAGLRAASLYDPVAKDTTLRDPIPVMGGDARWRWSANSMIRASAVSDAPGTDHDYLDVRLEHVWRFGGDTWLSLGWRHMQGVLSNEQPTPTLKQDAVLLELKFGF